MDDKAREAFEAIYPATTYPHNLKLMWQGAKGELFRLGFAAGQQAMQERVKLLSDECRAAREFIHCEQSLFLVLRDRYHEAREATGELSGASTTQAQNYQESCYDCVVLLGGIWPLGHRPTASKGTCPHCKKPNKDVIPWSDFNWPKHPSKP